jgi:hypothetical protein
VYKILKDAASDFHDLDNLGDPDKDVAISCSSRFVARLYDQKSFASSHQWNTDGELSRILCIQSTLKEACQQNFSVI